MQVPALFNVQYFGDHQTTQEPSHLMICVHHSRMSEGLPALCFDLRS